MTRLARRPAGDEGSALVIALLFITSFSLLLGSVITFAEVGLKASKTLSAQADSAYATDGAMNAAINRFRNGVPCDNYTAPLDPDGQPLGGRGVIVRCVDDKDDNRPASSRAIRPVNALLSLGAEGISTPSGFEQRVLGNIFSNSTVKAGAKLIVQGQASAVGTCNSPTPGNLQTSPSTPLRCADNPDPVFRADPSQGRDPDYTKALTTVPIRQVVPGCPAAGWLVPLEPGYYDDAGALSALTNGACPGRVVWMKPGNYYLDLDFQGGNGTWVVNDPSVVVVGGSPRGWVPDPAAPLPAPALSVPGSCQADAADGVQVIAGGGTNLRITKGQVEVCATPRADDQSIALYGIGPDRPVHTLEPSDWSGVTGFVRPDNATVIGETPLASATAVFAAGPAPASAAMTLTGFRPDVPAGSLIDSAILRVAHREDGNVASVTVAADFPGSTCTGTNAVTLTPSPALTEDQINLKVICGLTSSNPAAFAGLKVTYSVTTGGAVATDILDGIAVDVAYRTPRTGKPNAVTTLGFVNETNAQEIGEQPTPLTADASLTSSGATTASITLAGLGDPPIQPGSIIESAVLRVAHQDQGDIAPPTVTVPFAGGTCTGLVLPVNAAGIVDDRVNLKACGLDTAEELVGLTARYDAKLAAGGNTATANLDGMWLELVYNSPAQTRPPATVTSSAASPTTAAFSSPDNAKAVGEAPPLTADAVLTSATPTATLTFGGYDVPAGSVVESAVLRVVHQDIGPIQTPTLAVSFPGMSGCPALTLTKRATALGEDRMPDLTPCGLTDAARLAALAVTYTANLTAGATTPPDATARVDGVVLDVTYRPPTSRRPTTVSTTTPGFSNLGDVKIIGESPTPLTGDVTLAPGAAPAAVTVGGYGGVPAGSVIESAVLRVAHQDDAGMGPVTLATAFDGNTCATPQPVPQSPGTIGVFRSVNLKTCGLDRVDQLAELTATYTVKAPTTASTTQVPATSSAVTGFTNPDNARAVDGVTADAPLDSASNVTSASLTLGGYNQPPPPPNSTIKSATLRVAHQEDPGMGPVTATVSFTGGSCAPQTLTPKATLGEDTIDLAACGLNDPTKLTDLTVTYAAALDNGTGASTARLDGAVLDLTYAPPPATDRLDGIELDVVYRTPTFRPLNGCLTEPYPAYPALLPDPAVACALVKVTPPAGDITTRFAVQGTVYAPSAALDISMAGLKEQVLTRGLVARAIRLGLKADLTYKRPLMGVPPEPVKFTAYPDVTVKATVTDTPTPFSNPGNALAIGEKPTRATSDATLNDATPAPLTLRGFPPDALPAGTVIDAAVLRVVHRVDAGVDSATVTVGGFTTGPCAAPLQLPLYSAFGEEQIDLTACGLTDPAQLSNLSVTYTATAPAATPATPAVAQLDGITLDLLSGPLLRARVAFDTSQVTVQGWSVLR